MVLCIINLKTLSKNPGKPTVLTLNIEGRIVREFYNNFPGREWALRFLKCHNAALTQQMSKNIKNCRALVSSSEITKFFYNLKITLKYGEEIQVPSSNVFNYDETNLSDNPGSKRCIFKAVKNQNVLKTEIRVLCQSCFVVEPLVKWCLLMLLIKLNIYGQHGPKVGLLMYDIIELSQDGLILLAFLTGLRWFSLDL